MPKTVFTRPKIDRARALILERKRQYRKSNEDMAKCLGCCEKKYRMMMDAGTSTWSLNDLFKVARYLDIEKEEIKAVI